MVDGLQPKTAASSVSSGKGSEPAALDGHLADHAQLPAAHYPGAIDIAIGIALAHAHQDLSVVIHLEPLVQILPPQRAMGGRRLIEIRAPNLAGWRHYGENGLAPSWRKLTGLTARRHVSTGHGTVRAHNFRI